MNPKKLDPQKFPLSGPDKVHNPLEVMQDGEEVIFEIKRDPAGIFGLYLGSGLLLIIIAVMCFIFVPKAFDPNNGAIMFLSALIFMFVALLILIFVFISTVVYWGNHWIVTTDSLTQLSQINLFKKQSAQLALDSLEDVTVEQNGIWAKVFGYGNLKAETAGEASKFVFRFCPDPEVYAQKLLATREAHDKGLYGGEVNQPAEQSPVATHTAPQQPQQQPQPQIQRDISHPTVEQLGQAALADFPQNPDPQNPQYPQQR